MVGISAGVLVGFSWLIESLVLDTTGFLSKGEMSFLGIVSTIGEVALAAILAALRASLACLVWNGNPQPV